MKLGIRPREVCGLVLFSCVCTAPALLWFLEIPVPGSKSGTLPPSIAIIQTLSDLATNRVHITDGIEGENSAYIGKWLLHGEAVLGVDLSRVTYLRLDADKKEAVLSLPPPHLISTKVDHERSAEISLTKRFWIVLGDKKQFRDEVWKQADRKIRRLALEPKYIGPTKAQAEKVLHNLFGGVGWQVRFEWQAEAATPADGE